MLLDVCQRTPIESRALGCDDVDSLAGSRNPHSPMVRDERLERAALAGQDRDHAALELVTDQPSHATRSRHDLANVPRLYFELRSTVGMMLLAVCWRVLACSTVEHARQLGENFIKARTLHRISVPGFAMA